MSLGVLEAFLLPFSPCLLTPKEVLSCVLYTLQILLMTLVPLPEFVLLGGAYLQNYYVTHFHVQHLMQYA